ncbi:AIM24 family protein [Umezawaea sp.]|uniref:AIM24 family protein n=1 Tax=Umezawaea sp. TaxID=1955258 RepID=UPI002ED12EF1
MQVRTRHTPTFGVARLVLAPGEPVLVERSSLVASSYGVVYEPKPGPPLKAQGKGVTAAGCTAGPEGGWVDVAPPLPGDLHVLELDGITGWCVAKTSWLASAGTVGMDPVAPPLRALQGGDGGFLTYVVGHGPVVLTCYGTLDIVVLAPGELVSIAGGHVVGFGESLQCRLRALAPDGAQSMRTGEGLAFDFAGPGVVLTQTRSPQQLGGWLHGAIGSRS